MDVERTIEFILEMQAKAEVRMARFDEQMAKAEARMDRADARMDRLEARMDKFDKSLNGIRKLLQTGMKLLVKIEKRQAATDIKLERLIDSWGKRRTNGHHPSS